MSASHDPFANHFDEVTGLLYLEGQLDEERASEVAAHVASCAECGQLLRALERESVWLREALTTDDESIPARVIAAPQRTGTHWGWIAAFGLCAAGLYTVWNGFVAPAFARASEAGFSQGNVFTMLFFQGAFWQGWDTVRNMTEFLALATLAGVAIWLLRKQWHRFTAISLVMGALICVLGLPPAAQAADVERGNPSYTLPAGQEVKTDLIVIADHVRIDGDIDGDLIVTSQYVEVNGHIKGDILAFGGELRVNGPVDGNVRAWCQTLNLNSTVGRNVMAFTGVTEFADKATVGGTMTSLSGNADLNGRVQGDLLARAGEIEINGFLGHDAQIHADRLTIGSDAQILGQTKYEGRRQPDIAAGAKLGSPIQITMLKRGPNYSQVAYYWHRVLFWGASFLFGLVVLLLVPGFFADAVQATKRVGPALGFGILFLFATPIVAIIACITIVGLGVGITTLLLYAIALYSAQVFVGSWLGEQLLGAGVGLGPAIGRLALGLAIIRALTMIPFAGSLILLIVTIWGLGALVLALHRKMSPHIAAAV
jgi:cytoskeletal protein CcmA (bactofilin family)